MIVYDTLVIGAGPAGLSLCAALAQTGLKVHGLSPKGQDTPWKNTYGIWADDLERLGLVDTLAYRWSDCTAYTNASELPLRRDYGLFDNTRLQQAILAQNTNNAVTWHTGLAGSIEHTSTHSVLTTRRGELIAARLVIDASGHNPALVQRPQAERIAYQVAYGIVGEFSSPPVRPNQLVLMDYRSAHLSPAERSQPATFLYAMHLQDERYFIEETSLASTPAVSFDILEERLNRRLGWMGVQVQKIEQVERVLFPMNLAIPYMNQPILGYGAAASMVHPASGYQVGSALLRARPLAQAIAAGLGASHNPASCAQAAWQALWPASRRRRRAVYIYGLNNLLRFDELTLQDFFTTFYRLPVSLWSGYLSDTLSTTGLLSTMLILFLRAPRRVRRALAGSLRWGITDVFRRAG